MKVTEEEEANVKREKSKYFRFFFFFFSPASFSHPRITDTTPHSLVFPPPKPPWLPPMASSFLSYTYPFSSDSIEEVDMFGDCQVMCSVDGNAVCSDPVFSSPVRNSNFNFISSIPFSAFLPEEAGVGLMIKGKEDNENGSGSEHQEGASGTDQENEQQPKKKKRYHRHTAHQIQVMETLFRECPHPDDKQRMRLSQDLCLKPRQVKFWFQNRRTQMKAQQDRADNAILRNQNESLKIENYRLQATLRNIICPNCTGTTMMNEVSFDEQQLRLENSRLREELDRICSITSRYNERSGPQVMGPVAAPMMQQQQQPSLDLDMSIYTRHFHEAAPENCSDMLQPPASHGGIQETPTLAGCSLPIAFTEEEKTMAFQLAMSSAEELVNMCCTGEPLWVESGEVGREVLNVEEHGKMFPWPINSFKSEEGVFRTEATRSSAVVIMNSINLVDAFMDASKWTELFPSIVSRAKTLQIIPSDSTMPSPGTLEMMYAEMQVLSPLVPTREAQFLRYCQHNEEEGSWTVVDFPLDSVHDGNQSCFQRYRRRPSGCIIEDRPNGYSRVTWVEHVEVGGDKAIHQVFNNLVESGMAFGAHRWLAVLQRQCERIASLLATNICDIGVIPSLEAKKNLMKLSQRMVRNFCVNVSTSNGQTWTALSDSSVDTVRISTRKSTEPGQPNGMILSAVSTTWLPYPHFHVFDLLRDPNRRSKFDILSNGNALQEVAHIANGSHTGSCISLLRVNVASNSSQGIELVLQESSIDGAESMVVFSTIDVEAVQMAMSSEDPSPIPLLPIGFSIIPACGASSSSSSSSSPPSTIDHHHRSHFSGCLLTIGLQVVAASLPSAKINLSSVTAINNHLSNTLHQILSALDAFSAPLHNNSALASVAKCE